MARMRPRNSTSKQAIQQPPEEAQDTRADEEELVIAPVSANDAPTRPLRFDEPLNWRAGRAIPVSDLLTRLQALFAELCEIDQEEADRKSITPKAQELANAQLLAHKDKGVRAWSLLCIVKVFHLLAPDAPYKASQLQDIFALFVTQILPAFGDSTNPYTQQYIDILTSFAGDKSVLLVLDIPNSDSLVLQIFENAFDIMASNSKDATVDRISKNMEYQLTTLLAAIVEEAESLPNEVVDVILAQFLRADTMTSDVEARISPSPAYDMARAVCNSSITKMIKYVSSYFSSVLIDASETVDDAKTKPRSKKRKHDDDNDSLEENIASGPSAEHLSDAGKAHRLLRELWRSCPDVIQGVIPQIEAELSAEGVNLRVMAVETVGDLVSGIGLNSPAAAPTINAAAWPPQSVQTGKAAPRITSIAPYSFSTVYADCYQAFMDRHRDRSAAVRVAWLTSASRIIVTNAGGIGLDSDQEETLLRFLRDSLRDNDEKVRLAGIAAFAACDYQTLNKVFSRYEDILSTDSLLHDLRERAKDTKLSVRAAALELLASFWGIAAGAIAEGDSTIRPMAEAIASCVLETRYLNLPDVNQRIPALLHDFLLPTTFPPIKAGSTEAQIQSKDDSLDPDAIRAKRVLVLVQGLNDRAASVFFAMQKQQMQKSKYLSAYLTSCEAISGNKKDTEAKQKFDKIIEVLCSDMHEPTAAANDLRLFGKQHDKRNFQLIRFCLAADSDYRKVFKAMKELYKRLESGPAAIPAVLNTITPLLKSSALLILNRSHVPTFMHFASTDEQGLAAAANKLLKHIAENSSEVFKIHATELCQTLQRSQPKSSGSNDASLVDAIKTCVGFARRYSDGMPKDRAFYQAMTAYALYGSPPKTAKHAISIIMASADRKELYIDKILTQSITGVQYGAPHFLSRLAAIAQMQLLAPEQTEDKSDEIMTIAVANILREYRTTPSDADPEFMPLADIDEDLHSKLMAIKIVVNGLRGKATHSTSQESRETLHAAAAPVYKLLITLIDRDGELSVENKTPKHHRTHLRLAASISLLKVCSIRSLDALLTPADFNRLATLCQDPLPEVRQKFGSSLMKYIGRGKLPSRFLALVFLYAFEPLKPLKQSMVTFVRARAAAAAKREEPDTVLENIFARLLSLLAHHPDQEDDSVDHAEIVDYIVFYLNNVATEANLPVLYNVAQRLKTVQDAVDGTKSDSLYLVSDFAEATIRAFHEEKGWSFQAMSQNVRLPHGLFSALPPDLDAQALAEKQFLDEDMIDKIPDIVRAILKPRRRKAERPLEQHHKRPKTAASTSGMKTKRATTTARKRSSDMDIPSPRSNKKSKATHDEGEDSVRRRSSRNAAVSQSYMELSSDDEDDDGERWDDDEANKENHEQILEETPPTSSPPAEPAPKLGPISSGGSIKVKKKTVPEKGIVARKTGTRSSGRLTRTSDEVM